MEKLTSLLKPFIGGNENAELQCLYTIQKLIVKLEHPQGMLVSIFGRLYDDDVLSFESLKKWRDSDDPMEKEGKGEFFIKLRERRTLKKSFSRYLS